jgi:heme/copper-type cytochrome/quinol oxidase subunit 2
MSWNRFAQFALTVALVSGACVSRGIAATGSRADAPRFDLRFPAGPLVADAGGPSTRGNATVNAQTFDIIVKGGRLASGRRVLVVHRNDDVILRITNDAPDQFHLHGYNLLVDLAPGKTATLEFKATLTGRFTYELHKAELELGALEVYP